MEKLEYHYLVIDEDESLVLFYNRETRLVVLDQAGESGGVELIRRNLAPLEPWMREPLEDEDA